MCKNNAVLWPHINMEMGSSVEFKMGEGCSMKSCVPNLPQLSGEWLKD